MGVKLIEVNANESGTRAVAGETAIGDHLPDGALSAVDLLSRFADFHIAAARSDCVCHLGPFSISNDAVRPSLGDGKRYERTRNTTS
jgi:hypothetical protein